MEGTDNRDPAVHAIRQCLLKRGTWHTVAWVPEDQAVIGNEVEIVMMHDTGRTEDDRRVLEGRRERWTVAETWTLLPVAAGEPGSAHHLPSYHPPSSHDAP